MRQMRNMKYFCTVKRVTHTLIVAIVCFISLACSEIHASTHTAQPTIDDDSIKISLLTCAPGDEVYSLSRAWAEAHSPALLHLYDQSEERAKAILNIDRTGKNPRKDIAKWSEIENYISYFYDETFTPNYDLGDERLTNDLACAVLERYKTVFDPADDKDTWFAKIKEMCEPLGCTPNVKEYKKDPAAYRGHVGDLSTIIRVALTGRRNTPDLHAIIALLGRDTVEKRLQKAAAFYKEEK